ncbi:MAG TPA: glycosyltransferase family 39 protein [Casimicrobiaceae bacterium]|nr:glycosyltransferase family 39 protein [Casimicrobiaceae bacterium]
MSIVDGFHFGVHPGRFSVTRRGTLLLVFTIAWVLIGLVGHDPWKPDEAYTFGIVLDFLRHGDWVVPSLAGEPFVEKPPLFFLVAVGFAQLFGQVLPLHDAARLATGLFVGIALLFLALSGRELCGRGYGTMAVLVMIGCVGPTPRLHQLITDVALLAGVSVGMYGLAVARRSLWSGGAWLGVGLATAFLAKGLLGPGWLCLTAAVLPALHPWRTRGYAASLGVAALIAVVPVAIWGYALYDRSPALFGEWFITNNFGRFFGFTRIGPHNAPGFYEGELLWYAFPALPLSAWALWRAWRRHDSSVFEPRLALPLILATVMFAVLAAASDSRNVYLIPLLLPLSLIAAQGIGELPLIGTTAVSQTARWGLGALAATLWVGWITLLIGVPASLRSMLLAYQPSFVPKIHWVLFGLALGATALTARMLFRRATSATSAMTQWAAGTALCWCLIATLWAPYLNAGKSYRTMVRSLARQLPTSGCVASLHLGEPQRALLAYFANIDTVRLEVEPSASCPALLVQGWRTTGAPAPEPAWTLVWEGSRPGDQRELYQLYRRDVAPDHPIARFPTHRAREQNRIAELAPE